MFRCRATCRRIDGVADESSERARVRWRDSRLIRPCKFTGCTSRQLRYWDQIGLVEPSVQGTGGRPGVPRLYSFRDLVALRVVKSLLDGGMSLQRVRRAWEFLNKKARPRPAPVRGEARHRRAEHLQDLPPRRRGHGRAPRGADGVLRGDRRHRDQRADQRARSSARTASGSSGRCGKPRCTPPPARRTRPRSAAQPVLTRDPLPDGRALPQIVQHRGRRPADASRTSAAPGSSGE